MRLPMKEVSTAKAQTKLFIAYVVIKTCKQNHQRRRGKRNKRT